MKAFDQKMLLMIALLHIGESCLYQIANCKTVFVLLLSDLNNHNKLYLKLTLPIR